MHMSDYFVSVSFNLVLNCYVDTSYNMLLASVYIATMLHVFREKVYPLSTMITSVAVLSLLYKSHLCRVYWLVSQVCL